METRVFKTNLSCDHCVASVRPLLNQDPEIEDWQADVEDHLKLLKISGEEVDITHVRELVREAGFDVYEEVAPHSLGTVPTTWRAYSPLLLVFGFLAIGVVTAAWGADIRSGPLMLNHFLGACLLAFSFFKLQNLSDFVEAFRIYDVIGRRSVAYAYAYPFLELALGVSFLGRFFPVGTYFATLALSGVTLAGVVPEVMGDPKHIRCPCLGSFFNLPLSAVLLAENFWLFVLTSVLLARMA